MNEMFPPSEEELHQIIRGLKSRLEDDSYQDEWPEIAEQLKIKEQQLKDLTIQNDLL